MKYGFVLPYGDAAAAGELAELAENCEWDGFFVWEPVRCVLKRFVWAP